MATVANAAAVIAAVAIAILIYSAAAVLSSHTAAVLMNNITAVAVLQNTAAIAVLGYAVTVVVGDGGVAAEDCAAAAGLPLSTFQPPGKVELSVEVTVPFDVDIAAVLTADTAADVRCAAAAASQTPDSI